VTSGPTQPWETHFALSLWNAVTFLSLLAGAKWLCGVAGPAAYATATGNVLLAGVFTLAALAAWFFGRAGGEIFKVPADRRMDAFWFPNIWLAVGGLGAAAFGLRALMISEGFVATGEVPPKFIAWLFAPSALDWLLRIGN
jgi:hypothetical protein